MSTLMTILLVFAFCFSIGAVLNILLKTTRKQDWLITLFLSLGVSVLAQVMNVM